MFEFVSCFEISVGFLIKLGIGNKKTQIIVSSYIGIKNMFNMNFQQKKTTRTHMKKITYWFLFYILQLSFEY